MKIYFTHKFGELELKSHDLLSDAIAKYIGNNQEGKSLVEVLEISETGKPHIRHFNNFSISHSENTWAVLISNDSVHECGLDIQYHRRCNEVMISNRFYSSNDAKSVETAFEEERADIFFKIWARREALVKAAGTSAARADIPDVLTHDIVEYQERQWKIMDIEFPSLNTSDKIYAAVCTEFDEVETSSIEYEELIYD